MSAFEVFTWLAIAVLLVGSTAVFAWFVVDLVDPARARARRPKRPPAR